MISCFAFADFESDSEQSVNIQYRVYMQQLAYTSTADDLERQCKHMLNSKEAVWVAQEIMNHLAFCL